MNDRYLRDLARKNIRLNEENKKKKQNQILSSKEKLTKSFYSNTVPVVAEFMGSKTVIGHFKEEKLLKTFGKGVKQAKCTINMGDLETGRAVYIFIDS